MADPTRPQPQKIDPIQKILTQTHHYKLGLKVARVRTIWNAMVFMSKYFQIISFWFSPKLILHGIQALQSQIFLFIQYTMNECMLNRINMWVDKKEQRNFVSCERKYILIRLLYFNSVIYKVNLIILHKTFFIFIFSFQSEKLFQRHDDLFETDDFWKSGI